MKKMNNLAWMSALALAGAMGFTACSSDDDTMQNVNPSYDGKSVKTQFAINVPRAAQTRQTADITQNNSNFRGMQDVVIFSAKADPASANTTLNNVSLNATTIANNELSNNQKIYSDVTIPIGTTNFLFYGQATMGQDVSNAANGVLTLNTTATNKVVSDITGNLQVISNNETLSNSDLITILNGISGVSGWSTTDHVGLKTAYTGFTSLKSGSAYSILKEVERLYNNLIAIETTESQEPTELITAIKTKINESFIIDTNNSLTYQTESTFPEDLGLPQGSAVLKNTDGTFSYQASSAIGSINGLKPNTICYPAALYYRANTTLYASDNESVTWPTSLANWNDANSWTNWTSIVSATTRTIALQDNINYAVALLKTTVKIDNNVTTLGDNAQLKGNQPSNQQIPVKVGSGESATPSFNLTGVLIGGQPTQVNWEFLPTSDQNRTYTIYDNVMNGTIGVTSNTTPNYTMVLDNLMSTQSANQASINMAIELQNNSGKDFYGVDGIVPNGGKFYLVANLDMTNKTLEGVSKPHVFMQDYTTTANLTINSLKNAYVTIPDLRSTRLQLGLSVDLAWQAGLTFDVTIQ